MKYQFRLQELEADVGEIVVCVSESNGIYTAGVEYKVTATEDGKLGVMTDCGYIATTSASLFTPLKLLNATEVKCLKTDPLAPWSFPLATILAVRSQLPTETTNNDNFDSMKVESRAA